MFDYIAKMLANVGSAWKWWKNRRAQNQQQQMVANPPPQRESGGTPPLIGKLEMFSSAVLVVIITTIILAELSVSIFEIAGGSTGWLNAVVTYVIMGGINYLYFFHGGLFEIKIAHRGVPLFLGEPKDWFTLGQGLGWLLPSPFMGNEEVDARPIEIWLSGKEADKKYIQAITGNNVEMDMNGFVIIKITNPYTYVSEIGGKLETVQNSFIALATKALREIANTGKLSVTEINIIDGETKLVEIDKELKRLGADSKETNGPFSDENLRMIQEPLGILLKKLLQEEFADQWGIEIIKVVITKIVPTSTEFRRAQETKRIEEYQKAGEEVERDHAIGSIRKYRDDLSIPVTKAIDLFQSERDKASRLIVDGSATPLEKAGALAGNVLGSKE